MFKPTARYITVALVAMTLLALSAGPAAAGKFSGKGYASFSFGVENPTAPGVVLVDRVDADSGRLSALLLGLTPGEQYAIVGRSIGCNGTPSNANRVFRGLKVADTDGEAVVTGYVVELKDVLVSSIWVSRTDGGGAPACSMSLNFEEIKVTVVGDYNGDGAAGSAAHEYGHVLMVVQKRPNGKARVTIVADGLSGNDQFSFKGVNKGCGKAATQSFFTIEFAEGRVSNYMSKTVNMTQNQLDALRSVRVRNITLESNTGCMPMSIIGILIA